MKLSALIAALVVTTMIAFAPGAVAADDGAEENDDCGDFHVPEDRDCDGEIDEEFVGDNPGDSDGTGFWDWLASLFASVF